MSSAQVKFNAAFIDARMREHRAWQEREMQSACLDIVEGVELAQQGAAERVARDIRRSPLFRSGRHHQRPISPALLRAKAAAGV